MLKWKNTGIAAKQDNSQESKTLPFTQNILYIYSQAVYVCVCAFTDNVQLCVCIQYAPILLYEKKPLKISLFSLQMKYYMLLKTLPPSGLQTLSDALG